MPPYSSNHRRYLFLLGNHPVVQRSQIWCVLVAWRVMGRRMLFSLMFLVVIGELQQYVPISARDPVMQIQRILIDGYARVAQKILVLEKTRSASGSRRHPAPLYRSVECCGPLYCASFIRLFIHLCSHSSSTRPPSPPMLVMAGYLSRLMVCSLLAVIEVGDEEHTSKHRVGDVDVDLRHDQAAQECTACQKWMPMVLGMISRSR